MVTPEQPTPPNTPAAPVPRQRIPWVPVLLGSVAVFFVTTVVLLIKLLTIPAAQPNPQEPSAVAKVTRSTVPPVSAGAPASAAANAIGEIVVHNETKTAVGVELRGGHYGSSILRTFDIPADANARIGSLSPDDYSLAFRFPRTKKLEVGPLTIAQTDTAQGSSADRYEITLKPQ